MFSASLGFHTPNLRECFYHDSVSGSGLTIDFSVGDLRLRLPLPVVRAGLSRQLVSALNFSHSCPQHNYTLPRLPGIDYSPLRGFVTKVRASEDCEFDHLISLGEIPKNDSGLYLNVFRPAGVSADAKLPVVVWIYGGGFSVGDASSFNATNLVSRSVQLGNSVIYVSFNYRVNGFGFLGGREVKEAGVANLGIHDRESSMAKTLLSNGSNPIYRTLGLGLGPRVHWEVRWRSRQGYYLGSKCWIIVYRHPPGHPPG